MGTLLGVSSGKQSSEKSGKQKKLLYTVLMLLIGCIMVAPIVFMLSASFRNTVDVMTNPLNLFSAKSNLDNYRQIFRHPFYFGWYWNSIWVVALCIVFRVLVVSMAAYAFARLRFRGREILFLFLLSTIMVTPDTTIVSRYLLYKYMGLIDTPMAIIIPAAFNVFFMFLMRQFFMGIPYELTEAALVDGCSHYRIFFQVILPLAKPAMMTVILFTFIWTWNDFVTPFLFITPVQKQLLTVGLGFFQNDAGSNISLQMAGASLGIIPPILVFIAAQDYFVEGIASSGIKG